MTTEKKAAASKIIATIIAQIVLVPLIATWLWNALMTKIFGLPALSVFQMLGLMILVNSFIPMRGDK